MKTLEELKQELDDARAAYEAADAARDADDAGLKMLNTLYWLELIDWNPWDAYLAAWGAATAAWYDARDAYNKKLKEKK